MPTKICAVIYGKKMHSIQIFLIINDFFLNYIFKGYNFMTLAEEPRNVESIRHSRLPAGNALWFCQNLLLFLFNFFLFFRHQGFQMIIFDRQAGPLQNFNRSHVMVIGRSVSFSDPARPPGGAPQTPQNPPPPSRKKKICACVSEHQEHLKKIILVGKKNFCRFKTPGTFLSEHFFSSVTKNCLH